MLLERTNIQQLRNWFTDGGCRDVNGSDGNVSRGSNNVTWAGSDSVGRRGNIGGSGGGGDMSGSGRNISGVSSNDISSSNNVSRGAGNVSGDGGSMNGGMERSWLSALTASSCRRGS